MMNGSGFWVVGILLIPLFAQAEISGHQQRTLEFAEHAIVQGKGAEPELGLGVIGEGNGPQSLQFLTELVRWQRGMDAGQGESYTCYLLSKGNAILPYLEQMDPVALRRKCVAEFDGRKYGLKSSDNVDYICRSEKNIRLKKADIIVGIRNGIVCNDEDW